MKNKKVSIVIPVCNEINSINILIRRISSSLSAKGISYEIIFIDDNSTDGTFEHIGKIRNGPWSIFPNNESVLKNVKEKIRVFRKKGKKGKAFSLIEGFQKAKGDIIAMIDGDIQYPPEAISEMIEALDNADVVVANRKNYNDGIIRRIISTTFRVIFGKLLFGMNHDIQSGLKVMTREVIETIKFVPGSAWTFDLEFLHRARQAGFVIENFDISFARRKNGISKITFIKTTFEIGLNALVLRRKRIHPVELPGKYKGSMLGAGIGYKKKKYITHTSMPHYITAIRTITLHQKIILLLIVFEIIIGFIFYPLLTLQLIVGVLSFIYFMDVLFNFFLVLKSLTFPEELSFSPQELEGLNEKKLPIYTILCPLYKEARILPQFLDSMNNLSWPKEKLDVILLLEEDDNDTIDEFEKMNLPFYVRTLIVPHSIPKTKPKACNYGLVHARGEYLVVYDAEDIPDIMQLKKAYLGFQKVDKDIICLQAKLNYYNPHQNLLTRFFTAEYSLWFDVTLPGLQSINTTIPLGGTSNHFRVKNLVAVEGWDPFNVTEDADLGIRLFRRGYRTAIIDSTTLEEANSKIGNWLRQRSRWIKGYMQTYLVHIREASRFAKYKGRRHSLVFQLVIGGKIAFILINPILWLATISYFTLYAYVGPAIESVYPTVVFYMAVTSLVFGNFLFLYYYMIGVAKKGQWNLMKFVFLIPFYWLMISIAAFRALYQLIFRPHYWEKTVHGFHLNAPNKNVIAEAVVGAEESSTGFVFPWDLRKRLIGLIANKKIYMGGFFVISIGASNFFNFLYNAFLGRVLNLEDFALVSLFSSFLALSNIFSGPFGKTVNYKTGYLIGKQGEEVAFGFWRYIRRKAIFISVILGVLWLVLSPVIVDYFRLPNIFPVIIFLPIILFGFIYAVDNGFLSSRLRFGSLAVLVILESSLKLGFAAFLVLLGLKYWTFSAIPLSVIAVFVCAWFLVARRKANKTKTISLDVNRFPFKFFSVAFLSGISTVVFLNLDIVLAKHYLTPSEAGLYSLLSLIGKMVFFLGSFTSPFIMPLVSRNEGANKDSIKILRLTLAVTFICAVIGFIAFGLFGKFTTPILFGEKVVPLAPYLIPVCFAMLCFALSRVFKDYYLAKKYYTFTAITFILACTQLLILSNVHSNLSSFVFIMCSIWITHFALSFAFHLSSRYIKTFENNLSDLFGLFSKVETRKDGKLRILIFNWRDTKHKWAGGAEVYVHELAKRWVKDGNTVTIFSGKGGQKLTNEKIDGIQMYRRGGFYTVYIWAFLYYMFKFRGKFDVIIDSENGIPFFTPLYAKENKFLLIHHVHQDVFRKSLKWPLSWIASSLEAKFMPLVYRNVQVITVSPSSKDEILKHKLTKKDPIIIYNGVDLEKFIPGEKSKIPLVLYIGRLQYYKSLNIFIKAAKKILEDFSDVNFVIAGEGGEKRKLQKLSQKLEIKDKIKFLGKVSEERKVKLFQRAWVFVNPSLMEGWGITTIEAAACGTPAIASDVPGLRDSIKNPHTGILVKYGDYQSFAKEILILIKDKELRNQMSLDSIEWAKNFTWEKSAELYYKLMVKTIVGGSKYNKYEK